MNTPSARPTIIGVSLSDFARSTVSGETIEAYLATHYRFWGERPLTLLIGQVNPDLASVFRERGLSSAAVITAWNPFGEIRPSAENHTAQARLIDRIDALGLAHLEGHGADPAGLWTPEDSRLVLGLDLDRAADLGRAFAQNAIVWADVDVVPRLVMLR